MSIHCLHHCHVFLLPRDQGSNTYVSPRNLTLEYQPQANKVRYSSQSKKSARCSVTNLMSQDTGMGFPRKNDKRLRRMLCSLRRAGEFLGQLKFELPRTSKGRVKQWDRSVGARKARRRLKMEGPRRWRDGKYRVLVLAKDKGYCAQEHTYM